MILGPFVARNAYDGRQIVWAHGLVDRDGQGHRACRQDAAELCEHVDSEADVTAELSVEVGMENHRNVHQFHKFEQMVENTFHEPGTVTYVAEVDDLSKSKILKCAADMSILVHVAAVN